MSAVAKHDGESISCEPFGYTPDTMKIWWLPETKEKFSYEDGCFYPYDGPVIHGTATPSRARYYLSKSIIYPSRFYSGR